LIEQRVRFGSALGRPRFLAVGAIADEIAREVEQQVLPELAARPLVEMALQHRKAGALPL